ncbi:hypothetical protein ABZ484_03800 [Streptomyces sp. NPDC006393]|uniref:hypothetical protein n=1 Tax=Streptomyces sp. NPDC006393 TaxID=3156763 RepID=UPI0033C0AF5C
MGSVAEVRGALEEHALGGTPVPVERLADVPTTELCHMNEHDVAMLLLLGAVCARLDGGASAAPILKDVARRYMTASLLYSGRVLPRAEEMVELLDRGVDEGSPDILAELADHLSQGWPEYGDSVFPPALARLAGQRGLEMPADSFTRVSFLLWRQGLAAAAENRAEEAVSLFEQSLERYRKYLYYADAAWLFTDLVIALLLAGQISEAKAVHDLQLRYVTKLVETYADASAEAGQPSAFHLGDLQSGSYSTFVESVTLRPKGLTEQDKKLLVRYLDASERFIAACRYGSRRDFEAGLDIFSFGWVTFQRSPYPRILRHLAERYCEGVDDWHIPLTAHERWQRMLSSYRMRVKAEVLVATAVGLHNRLAHAGMEEHANLVLLDAAILFARLHGTDEALDWITRYLGELRPKIPKALSAGVNYLQTTQHVESSWMLARYAAERADILAPDLFSLGLDTPWPTEPRVDIALYDQHLSLGGITVYETTPPPLLDVLAVLGEEFTRSREEGRDVPFLSAAELSRRTGRTPGALAQAVRRFRSTCKGVLHEATELNSEWEDVIQGRPGYRLNPHRVGRFLAYASRV